MGHIWIVGKSVFRQELLLGDSDILEGEGMEQILSCTENHYCLSDYCYILPEFPAGIGKKKTWRLYIQRLNHKNHRDFYNHLLLFPATLTWEYRGTKASSASLKRIPKFPFILSVLTLFQITLPHQWASGFMLSLTSAQVTLTCQPLGLANHLLC